MLQPKNPEIVSHHSKNKTPGKRQKKNWQIQKKKKKKKKKVKFRTSSHEQLRAFLYIYIYISPINRFLFFSNLRDNIFKIKICNKTIHSSHIPSIKVNSNIKKEVSYIFLVFY